jgi:hypothetical protein
MAIRSYLLQVGGVLGIIQYLPQQTSIFGNVYVVGDSLSNQFYVDIYGSER